MSSIDCITVSVPASPQNYQVSFPINFETLKEQLKAKISNKNYLVVTDSNVYKKTDFFQKDSLFSPEKVLVLSPGESYKNWSSIDQILTKAFEQKLDRTSTMISVGGGVVGDMTGFAASIFMRGIDCIQVPTTLLSMVDASIGGKTGIDCSFGKNLIGTIQQPQEILVCEDFFQTLPDLEIGNGIAEMVKHGIITDPQHFADLEKLSKKSFDTVKKEIFSLARASMIIKKSIIEKDEKESGIRKKLNLGHSFGHGIELCSNFQIPHGRAVAIGCVMASQFALEKGICEEDTVDQIENIFHQFGIDLSCEIPESDIWEAMAHDKKKKGSVVSLILPKAVGEVVFFEAEL